MPSVVDPKITVGNIITAATIAGALVVGWVNFGASIETNAKDIAGVAARVDRIESNFTTLLNDLNQERVDQTRILTELQTDIKYIKERL